MKTWLCFVLFFVVSVHGTVLTFTINDVLHDQPIPSPAGAHKMAECFPGYGSNVSGPYEITDDFIYHYEKGHAFTPDIRVEYRDGTDAVAIRYYNEPKWPQVLFLCGTGKTDERIYFITFKPAREVGVRVNSFKLFGYLANAEHTADWQLHEDSPDGKVFDSGTADTEGNQENPTVVKTAGKVYQGTVVLEIHHLKGPGTGFGMDDVDFDQAPPPPSEGK